MFVDAVFPYRVRLSMQEVGGNVRSTIETRACAMLEGVCSDNGFVRPGTVRVVSIGQGRLSAADMCRYVNFDCLVKAEVYNPPPRFRHVAYVRTLNAFGALLEAGYWDEGGALVPVIEVVVVRDPVVCNNEVPVEGLGVGDEVVVEILSSRFDLRDTHMTGYGRLVRALGEPGLSPADRGGRATGAAAAAADPGPGEDPDSVLEDFGVVGAAEADSGSEEGGEDADADEDARTEDLAKGGGGGGGDVSDSEDESPYYVDATYGGVGDDDAETGGELSDAESAGSG